MEVAGNASSRAAARKEGTVKYTCSRLRLCTCGCGHFLLFSFLADTVNVGQVTPTQLIDVAEKRIKVSMSMHFLEPTDVRLACKSSELYASWPGSGLFAECNSNPMP